MPDNLRQKALHGVWWSAVEAGGGRLVQFVIGVVLARLLLPEQFGLVGMVSIFMAFSHLLVNGGFGQAIVQRKDLTDTDISSVFFVNLAVAVLMAGLLVLAAPAIAAFFEQPELTALTRFMALSVAIGGFSVVQQALLTRDLKFKALTQITLVATIAAGTVGISLAYQGFGVWALAWQALAGAAIRAGLLWIVIGWRPRWRFSRQSLQEMFSYGWKLTAAGLMHTGFQNVYRVVIGKFYAPADLGFYTRATGLQQTATLTISRVISRVTFPVFATIQDDPVRLRRGMSQMLQTLALANTPVMLGLLVVAKPLVIVLLTDKWLPSVPLFQVFCLMGMLFPLQMVNVQFLTATGRSGLNLRIEVAKGIVRLTILAATCWWGLLAIAWGQAGGGVVAYMINCHYTARLLDYGMRRQLSDVFPYFAAAGTMAAIVYPIIFVPGLNEISLLAIQVVTGAALFVALCRVFRLRAFEGLHAEFIDRLQTLAVRRKA